MFVKKKNKNKKYLLYDYIVFGFFRCICVIDRVFFVYYVVIVFYDFFKVFIF